MVCAGSLGRFLSLASHKKKSAWACLSTPAWALSMACWTSKTSSLIPPLKNFTLPSTSVIISLIFFTSMASPKLVNTISLELWYLVWPILEDLEAWLPNRCCRLFDQMIWVNLQNRSNWVPNEVLYLPTFYFLSHMFISFVYKQKWYKNKCILNHLKCITKISDCILDYLFINDTNNNKLASVIANDIIIYLFCIHSLKMIQFLLFCII